jgi:hypothetical protein
MAWSVRPGPSGGWAARNVAHKPVRNQESRVERRRQIEQRIQQLEAVGTLTVLEVAAVVLNRPDP